MRERPEQLLERIREDLHYVAREAEVLRPTELVLKSSELARAAADLDALVAERDSIGSLRLRIGRMAVDATAFRKNPYDLLEPTKYLVEPGEEHELRFKYMVPTEPFNAFNRITEPVYGFLRYFDLATIGRTIDDGGELRIVKPESSSSE